MKLSKNKVAGGVLGLLAIVSIVNTQAILKLTNFVTGDSSSGMSLDGSNQSAQVVNFSTKTTENAVYKRGDKSDVILQVQKALTSKGLYKGDISGLMGPKTEKAISDFQKSDGLTVTGTLDQKTIDAVLRGGGSSGDTAGTVLPACTRNSEPWIRVLSPNGGEVYGLGQEINVTWRTCNISSTENLVIGLIDAVASFDFQASSLTALNDAQEIFTLPVDDVVSGQRYKIGIWTMPGESGVPVYLDWSNNNFTITDEEDCAEGTIIGYNSNGTPIYCGDNIHFGTSACGLEVLTPAEDADIDSAEIGYLTTIVRIDYLNGTQGLPCGWSSFEGYAGSVKLIDLDTGNILANGVDLGSGSGLHFISSTNPNNPYSGTAYFKSSLQLVSPLPSNISENVYLRYTEEISGEGQSTPDVLYLPVNFDL